MVEIREQDQISFADKLSNLSKDHLSAKPLEITDRDVEEIKQELQSAGFELNISVEAQQTLRDSQFRNIDHGRGIGVSASAGRQKAQNLWETCEQVAANHNWTQKFPSGGTGLGLKHAMADFIALAILPKEDRPKIVNKLNQRLLLGYKKVYGSAPGFANIKEPLEPKKWSTVPPGSLAEIWQMMTSK